MSIMKAIRVHFLGMNYLSRCKIRTRRAVTHTLLVNSRENRKPFLAPRVFPELFFLMLDPLGSPGR